MLCRQTPFVQFFGVKRILVFDLKLYGEAAKKKFK